MIPRLILMCLNGLAIVYGIYGVFFIQNSKVLSLFLAAMGLLMECYLIHLDNRLIKIGKAHTRDRRLLNKAEQAIKNYKESIIRLEGIIGDLIKN